MRGRSELGGLAFVALASLQFGTIDVLARVVGRSGVSILPFLAARFALTGTLLLGILLLSRTPVRIPWRDRGRLLALGAGGNAVQSGLFFFAVRQSGAAVVTLIFFIYPVWVVLLALVLGEHAPTRLVGGAMLLSVVGTTLIFASEHGAQLTALGAALALGSSVAYASYLVAARRLVGGTTPLTATFWTSVGASGGLGAVSLMAGTWSWPVARDPLGLVAATGALGAFAFLCLFVGLSRADVVGASLVSSTEALAATVLAVAFLRESLTPTAVLGGAMLLVGAAIAVVARGRGSASARWAQPG